MIVATVAILDASRSAEQHAINRPARINIYMHATEVAIVVVDDLAISSLNVAINIVVTCSLEQNLCTNLLANPFHKVME